MMHNLRYREMKIMIRIGISIFYEKEKNKRVINHLIVTPFRTTGSEATGNVVVETM